ncbi:unnamed protein product [Vitrella brassicaformis CCMP3155]|uniref:Uncharacterized protein n=1 Tax=Vitrella brassicaformis (strain CCMP3155) TaxID=1169540 RepID=A0A0G4ESK7_VITBC|nr:unnamed protein product [Vitrella brassicaformis CCMP3155]|eukprot:CEM00982.1 unnamed protein product [Vitrella brassicaformis CCMP3155]
MTMCAFLIALAAVCSVAVASATYSDYCEGNDCHTGASFVDRTDEIFRLQTAGTHSNKAASAGGAFSAGDPSVEEQLALIHNKVKNLTNMMDRGLTNMRNVSKTTATSALNSIEQLQQHVASKEAGDTGK